MGPAPRRLRRARWSSPFGPDNAFLRTVAPVVTPLALVELPSAGSCTGSPHPASGKRRGRGRPQARRIASSAPRRSATPRLVSWHLIRKPALSAPPRPWLRRRGRPRLGSAPLLDGLALAVARGRHAACQAGMLHASRRPMVGGCGSPGRRIRSLARGVGPCHGSWSSKQRK